MNIEEYNQLAESLKPKTPYLKNCIYAFIYGGSIGVFGQLLLDFYQHILHYKYNDAVSLMSITLVLISCIITGLGLYDKIAKNAGAGTFIPITGFANSMTSSALEYKTEGFILGLGANIFKLAGSVITYGIVSSTLLGVLRYVFTYFRTFI